MNEQEKIENLMKPRYKVIADYPGNSIKVGTIITFSTGDDQRFHTGGVCEPYAYTDNGAITIEDVRWHDHLYKKLEWWEERTPEEMPEYVKDQVTGKVLRIEFRLDSHTPVDVKTWNDKEKPFWNILYDLTPATEAEYIAHTNQPDLTV